VELQEGWLDLIQVNGVLVPFLGILGYPTRVLIAMIFKSAKRLLAMPFRSEG